MERLAETLARVSLGCFRTWQVYACAPAGLADAMARAGHAMGDAADAGVASEVKADAAWPLYVVTDRPAAPVLPKGWRHWINWGLDAHGGLNEASPVRGLHLLLPPAYVIPAHMRQLSMRGHALHALELSRNLPMAVFRDDDERGAVAREELVAIAFWDRSAGAAGRLNRFALALDAFNRAVSYLPGDSMAYEVMGELWGRMGRQDMRARVPNSIRHVRGQERMPVPAPPPSRIAPSGARLSPRVLFVLHEMSDFGSDTLFEGLCEVLGKERVTEFPWKPTLHGLEPGRAMGYPCVYHRGGASQALEDTEAQLRAGEFDVVLFSDTLGTLPAETVGRIAAAGSHLPWFVLDMWDQCGDYREEIRARLRGVEPRAWFKREKLAGVDYGPAVYPLPFSYAAGYAGGDPNAAERTGVFWAGKPACGARRLVLEHLTRRFGIDPSAQYTQEAYRERLRGALLGLCLFGNGFDTVRYWELPANGVMLLAERPPIEIPGNFVDGESAVFFDDLGELEEKLAHYLTYPHEARAIADRGRAHYWAYHTAAARARQLLGWMEPHL